MAPNSLYRALLLTRSHRARVKIVLYIGNRVERSYILQVWRGWVSQSQLVPWILQDYYPLCEERSQRQGVLKVYIHRRTQGQQSNMSVCNFYLNSKVFPWHKCWRLNIIFDKVVLCVFFCQGLMIILILDNMLGVANESNNNDVA
jgi:hypothetical protein